MEDSITIIIAAYKRAESLKLALESIYKQTYSNWNVLIVADCCEDKFIKQFINCHPNVRIINLDRRCGNQYGPNSVGIYLSSTKYLTFLNHDDILLSDLSTAVEELKRNKSNFYLGTGAYCHYLNQEKYIEKEGRLLFSETNRSYAIWRCINEGNNNFFEPSSSIVIDTKLAKKTGYWNSPSQAYLSPLLDWIARIMLHQPIVSYSDKITTLKFNLHHTKPSGGDYSNDNYIEYISYYIEENPGLSRKLINNDILIAKERGLKVRPALSRKIKIRDEAKNIFHFLNFINGKSDEILLRESKKTREEFFLKVIENRTGER